MYLGLSLPVNYVVLTKHVFTPDYQDYIQKHLRPRLSVYLLHDVLAVSRHVIISYKYIQYIQYIQKPIAGLLLEFWLTEILDVPD